MLISPLFCQMLKEKGSWDYTGQFFPLSLLPLVMCVGAGIHVVDPRFLFPPSRSLLSVDLHQFSELLSVERERDASLSSLFSNKETEIGIEQVLLAIRGVGTYLEMSYGKATAEAPIYSSFWSIKASGSYCKKKRSFKALLFQIRQHAECRRCVQ